MLSNIPIDVKIGRKRKILLNTDFLKNPGNSNGNHIAGLFQSEINERRKLKGSFEGNSKKVYHYTCRSEHLLENRKQSLC